MLLSMLLYNTSFGDGLVVYAACCYFALLLVLFVAGVVRGSSFASWVVDLFYYSPIPPLSFFSVIRRRPEQGQHVRGW